MLVKPPLLLSLLFFLTLLLLLPLLYQHWLAPSAANHDGPNHDGQVVLRLNTTSHGQQDAILDAAVQLDLDIWAVANHHVDIRLHKDQIEPLSHLVPLTLRSGHSVLIPDLPIALSRSLPHMLPDTHVATVDDVFFQNYQPVSVVLRWMRLVEAMFPSHVQYLSMGKSFQGRDVAALRVGANHARRSQLHRSRLHQPPTKTIVILGSLHAREWISTTTVNYLAWSLATSFGKERFVTKLLEEFDFVFIPMVNPDGVDYTWRVDRLWRKSRQPTGRALCTGFDLDHAFSYAWNSSQIQSDACSEDFGGDKPFEAVEAMLLASWARNQSRSGLVSFVGLVDFHAYSQQILFPFSYSCSAEPPNIENLEEVAAGMAKAIRLSNGESYSASSACPSVAKPMVPGGGSALDWFYHELGAHFSYQIKLRDTGSHGFLLPREQIIPTGQEALDAIKFLGDFLLGNNGIEKSGPGQASSAGRDGILSTYSKTWL